MQFNCLKIIVGNAARTKNLVRLGNFPKQHQRSYSGNKYFKKLKKHFWGEYEVGKSIMLYPAGECPSLLFPFQLPLYLQICKHFCAVCLRLLKKRHSTLSPKGFFFVILQWTRRGFPCRDKLLQQQQTIHPKSLLRRIILK